MIIVMMAPACDRKPGPDSITSHGAAAFSDCTACHSGSGGIAPDPIVTNGSGTAGKHVAHVTSAGLGCERCHYQYASNPAHTTGTGTSVIFDPLNSSATPPATWTYTAAAGTVPQSGICTNVVCHTGSPPLDWYGTNTWTIPPLCSTCHAAPLGIRRQVLGAAGDFAANPAVVTRHVIGGSDPSPAQCQVCHDMTRHMGGAVRLKLADAPTTSIVYTEGNASSLEPFCLSCHDQNGAGGNLSPFADGATLGTMPYVASVTVASSWNGFSTHRLRGLTCAGTGSPGTGCHGTYSSGSGTVNMHGSTLAGMLSNTMNFEIALVDQATYSANQATLAGSYSESNYKLCFDCHANYPAVTKEVVLGFLRNGVYDIFEVRSPFNVQQRSRFRDHYNGTSSPFYSDTMWGYPYMALHNYHLVGFESRAIVVPAGVNALQWKYRGDPARIGRITCTACHNVHGTTVLTVRSTHEVLGLVESVSGADRFTSMLTPSMIAHPLNCAIDCHTVSGSTSYWHTPAAE